MRRLAASAVAALLVCACGSPDEPAATLQPTARSLLPPSADVGSPSPSASPGEGVATSAGAGAADAGDGGSAPSSRPAPAATKAPTPRPTREPSQPGIAGQVLAGGKPVTDAQVTISGDAYHHNTTTSSQGRFQSATPPGTYTIAASSPSVSGCAPRTVTVPKDAVAQVTITCGG